MKRSWCFLFYAIFASTLTAASTANGTNEEICSSSSSKSFAYFTYNLYSYDDLHPPGQNIRKHCKYTVYFTTDQTEASKLVEMGWTHVVYLESPPVHPNARRSAFLSDFYFFPEKYVPALLDVDVLIRSDSDVIDLEEKLFLETSIAAGCVMTFDNSWYEGDRNNLKAEYLASVRMDRWRYQWDIMNKQEVYDDYVFRLENIKVGSNKYIIFDMKAKLKFEWVILAV